MKISLLIALTLSLASHIQAASAVDKNKRESIEWVVFDLQPAYIFDGGRVPGGIMGESLKMITSQWVDVDHEFVKVPMQRVAVRLSEGGKVCDGARVIAQGLYATPVRLAMPMGLVVRKNRLNELPLDSRGTVDLDDLKRLPLSGVVGLTRNYQKEIQDVVPSLESMGKLSRSAMVTAINLLEMVGAGRVDYTFEYETALRYHGRASGNLSDLTWVPLRSLEPIVIYAACPATEWGRSAVLKIDSIVRRASIRRDYIEILNPWISSAALSLYEGQIKRFYSERARQSIVISP